MVIDAIMIIEGDRNGTLIRKFEKVRFTGKGRNSLPVDSTLSNGYFSKRFASFSAI